MKRIVVENTKLQGMMTDELQAMDEDDKDCQFGGIMPLRELDDDGCNWSEAIFLRCSGIPGNVCEAAAAAAIRTLRAKYNIE